MTDERAITQDELDAVISAMLKANPNPGYSHAIVRFIDGEIVVEPIAPEDFYIQPDSRGGELR